MVDVVTATRGIMAVITTSVGCSHDRLITTAMGATRIRRVTDTTTATEKATIMVGMFSNIILLTPTTASTAAPRRVMVLIATAGTRTGKGTMVERMAGGGVGRTAAIEDRTVSRGEGAAMMTAGVARADESVHKRQAFVFGAVDHGVRFLSRGQLNVMESDL